MSKKRCCPTFDICVMTQDDKNFISECSDRGKAQ